MSIEQCLITLIFALIVYIGLSLPLKKVKYKISKKCDLKPNKNKE